MTTRLFQAQLGIFEIRVYGDGTATFRRKRYASYTGARRALTRWAGPAFEVKNK